MRRRAVLIASLAVLVVVAVTTVTISVVAANDLDAVPVGELKQSLEANAAKFAENNGGKVPSTAQVVLTTRQASQDVVAGGAVVDSDQPVYLVQMEGDFSAFSAPIPQGADTPTAKVFWFLYDPATGATADWGLEDSPADLSKLGEVSSIEPTTGDQSASPSAVTPK